MDRVHHFVLQGSVPHSGNQCSGMCRTPCDHLDCWQCQDVKNEPFEMAKAIRQKIRDMSMSTLTERTLRKADRRSLLGSLPAQQPKDHQKATITRAALEGLAEKAGIAMDWNDGAPIFRDGGTIRDLEQKYQAAERAVLEQKVKELEKIASQQAQGTLTKQAANSLAKAAAQQMDSMVSDLIKQKVNETLREDLKNNEQTAIEKLKANGASDEDIAAAQELLGWKSEDRDLAGDFAGDFVDVMSPDKVQSYLANLDAQLQSVAFDEAHVLTKSKIISMTEALRRVGVDNPTFIVHPSAYKSFKDLIVDS